MQVDPFIVTKHSDRDAHMVTSNLPGLSQAVNKFDAHALNLFMNLHLSGCDLHVNWGRILISSAISEASFTTVIEHHRCSRIVQWLLTSPYCSYSHCASG